MSDPLVDQLNRSFETLAERLRAVVTEHAGATLGQLTPAIEAERSAAAEAAREESAAAIAAAEREMAARLTDEFAARESQLRNEAGAASEAAARQLRDELDAAHTAALDQQAARHCDRLSRLAQATRTLDKATSLSQALNILADAAGAEAGRVVLFLVRGETLRVWKQSGFPVLDGQPAFEIPLAAAGIVADAVRAGVTSLTNGARPAFSDRAATAFVSAPVMLDAQATAVVCAEAEPGDSGLVLASTLEVLARHAGKVLESLTAMRLAQATGIGAPRHAAGAGM